MASTPIRFNALNVIEGAYELIQVKGDGQTLTADESQQGLRRLNRMISSWAALPLTWPFTDRQVFSVTANVSTYTIGLGGDFDTARPMNLTGAGLLLKNSTPPVEIPRAILTDDGYQAIQIKTQTSQLWTDVYYQPTVAGGFGTIFLWPTPTTGLNDCVLYFGGGTATLGFENLTMLYDFAPGYADALEYNLAMRLMTTFGVASPEIRSDVQRGAMASLHLIKVANFKPADLMLDPAWTDNRRAGYNIQTGNY